MVLGNQLDRFFRQVTKKTKLQFFLSNNLFLILIPSVESYAGTSSGLWNPITLAGDQAAYIDVDTRDCNFRVTPSLVTSFVVNGVHQWVIGSAALYKPTAHGFRTYVDRVMNLKALKKTWRVSYVGYEGSSHHNHISFQSFIFSCVMQGHRIA